MQTCSRMSDTKSVLYNYLSIKKLNYQRSV